MLKFLPKLESHESPQFTLTFDTVDGSEIRGSPLEVGSLSHYFRRFFYIPGDARFLPSTVWSGLKLRIYKETSWWIGGRNQGSLEVSKAPNHHQELRSFNQKFRMTIRFSWNRKRPAKSGPTSTANRTRISLQHCTSGNGVWGWFTTQFLTQPS